MVFQAFLKWVAHIPKMVLHAFLKWCCTHSQKKVFGHNFLMECPMDLRSTSLSYILDTLLRDNPFGHIFLHMPIFGKLFSGKSWNILGKDFCSLFHSLHSHWHKNAPYIRALHTKLISQLATVSSWGGRCPSLEASFAQCFTFFQTLIKKHR